MAGYYQFRCRTLSPVRSPKLPCARLLQVLRPSLISPLVNEFDAPTFSIASDAGSAGGNRPWEPEECDTVLPHAPPHVKVVLGMLMNTGLDPSDALNLRRDQIDGETIWGVRGKTGVEVAIPIGPTLHAALKQAPQHDAPALLANSRGEQWTYNGFSTVWHRFKTGLEAEGLIQPGLTLKGLRHTVATTLREAGLDERRIADLLGQKTLSMARHYSRSANIAAKNRETMATLETENARRAQIVKPSAKSVKPKPKEISE